MSLKCLDCGNVFEDRDALIQIEYHDELSCGAFEKFYACPYCEGTDLVETVSCVGCGKDFSEKELISGYYCSECIENALTYDSFFDFSITGVKNPDDIDTLEDFIFSELFFVPVPNYSSAELKKYCQEFYKRQVANDKILCLNEFMEKIHDYFCRIPGIKEDFAEFLYEKEGKHEN